jgi:UDP-2,3-diacylglucosamine hydrolase
MDRPERGARFSRWVRSLEVDDALLIAGDLCDFWMGARIRESELLQCDGLLALADFRSRGGSLAIMPGNHDRWLCPFYEKTLGATLLADPFETTLYGLRLHLVHGHLLGGRKPWKAWMESAEFKAAFGRLPSRAAAALDHLLERKNAIGLEKDERRHLAVFRKYAARRRGLADVVVIGHVHRALDDSGSDPRLIVLGCWQDQSSYLRIDDSGASFFVVADFAPEHQSPEVFSQAPRPPNRDTPVPKLAEDSP